MAFYFSMYYSDETESKYAPEDVTYTKDSSLAIFDFDTPIFMALKLFMENETLQIVFTSPFHVYDQVDGDIYLEEDYHQFSFFKDANGVIEMRSEKFYYEGTEVDDIGMPYCNFSDIGKLELILKYKFIDNNFKVIEHRKIE